MKHHSSFSLVLVFFLLIVHFVRSVHGIIDSSTYTPYANVVDRFPGLVANTSANGKTNLFHGTNWNGDVTIPKYSNPNTYGPFAAYTSLPNSCFLYQLQFNLTKNPNDVLYEVNLETGSTGPLLPLTWRAHSTVANPLSIAWYEWLCVTDVNSIVNAPANRPVNYLVDIQPYLYTATWAQRKSWGSSGFVRTVCKNIDIKWLQRLAPGSVTYANYIQAPDIVDNVYGCFEQTMGFFHAGLPKLPGQLNDYTYENPTIQYYCVNHTIFFDGGNNPIPGGDSSTTSAYTSYDLRCFAYDQFADTYLDNNGNVLSGKTLPNTIDCSQATGVGSMLKMVEVCKWNANIGITGALPRGINVKEWVCESRCRYPCQTTAPYTTYSQQQVSAMCPPAQRSSQCNTNILSNPLLFCDPSETLSTYQVNPSASLNTFANEITSVCPVGTLGCRIDCNCRSTGCVNHPKCNGHGTLWSSSIQSLNGLSSTCMCEPEYTNDFCQDKVSDTVCNHGQEWTG